MVAFTVVGVFVQLLVSVSVFRLTNVWTALKMRRDLKKGALAGLCNIAFSIL
jgi:hypothetical protein